jgi:hypothetical protein
VLAPEQVSALAAAAAADGAAAAPSRRGAVFADLTERGFVVASGCRYGGDFVIYAAHPDAVHSSHTVRVVAEDAPLDSLDVSASCRVQGNVLKKFLYASVDPATHEATYAGLHYDAKNSVDTLKRTERELARAIRDPPPPRGEAPARAGDDPPPLPGVDAPPQ